ncbi:MAG: hypothetical protein H6595_08300 [Flavobacteriales bacterium]|nr:hypothetical protein [Flavobacteriales bacterium]MCB9167466.1 hypothetical protein [Flavobacteriales bacterium]
MTGKTMNNEMHMENKGHRWRKRVWLFPFVALAMLLLLGAIVQFLWNAVIPGLTGWALISYPKAIGLLVLSKILFSGPRMGPWGGRWGHARRGPTPWMMRGRWKDLSDEDREALRSRWREHCGRGPWHPSGEERGTEEKGPVQ